MSSTTSAQLELLRAKLALAIGPLDVNLAYYEVKAARPDALSEPWSTDMSEPHKLVVFNNKTFVLLEVADEQLASSMARGCPPIDAGENIKLYLNDVWQLEIFHMMGLDMAAIRDPVTGRDPMGSLYYSLIESVDQYILEKNFGEDGNKENESLRTEDVGMDEGWEEVNGHEGMEESMLDGCVQQRQEEKDEGEWMTVEYENNRHADAAMEGQGAKECWSFQS